MFGNVAKLAVAASTVIPLSQRVRFHRFQPLSPFSNADSPATLPLRRSRSRCSPSTGRFDVPDCHLRAQHHPILSCILRRQHNTCTIY
jgi:hypothetical protein